LNFNQFIQFNPYKNRYKKQQKNTPIIYKKVEKQNHFVGFVFDTFGNVYRTSGKGKTVVNKINKVECCCYRIGYEIEIKQKLLKRFFRNFLYRQKRKKDKNRIGVYDNRVVKSQSVKTEFQKLSKTFYLQ